MRKLLIISTLLLSGCITNLPECEQTGYIYFVERAGAQQLDRIEFRDCDPDTDDECICLDQWIQ